jgi:flavin reductase
MTVTAFASVSADPPTVLVSLGRDAVSTHAIVDTRRFGVSILAAEQLVIACYCAARGATKFIDSISEAPDGRIGSPVVAGALAHLDCELLEQVRVADHVVFVGRVRTARASQGGTPLVYHRRRYRRVAEPIAAQAPTGRTLRCLSS